MKARAYPGDAHDQVEPGRARPIQSMANPLIPGPARPPLSSAKLMPLAIKFQYVTCQSRSATPRMPPRLQASGMLHPDRAIRGILRHLVVDESVVEADRRSVISRIRVDDPGDSRPVGRSEAHRPGLAARVQRRTFEAEVPRPGRPGGWPSPPHEPWDRCWMPLVPAFGQHLASAHDHRAERPAEMASIRSRDNCAARARWIRSSVAGMGRVRNR